MKFASLSKQTLSLSKGLFAFFFFALSWINSTSEEKVAAISFNFVKTSCNQFDFTINNSGTYSLVQWDFGDGNTSTSFTPTHYYGTVGTYNVCLQGVNGSVVDTSCQQITVEDCCLNQAVQYTETTACCFELMIDNAVDQFYTGVKIRLDNPGQMQAGINFDPAFWGLINPPTPTCLELGYVGSSHIPLGNSIATTFCLDAPTTGPLAVHVDWLVGPDSICTTTDSLECMACVPDGSNFSTFIQAKTHTPTIAYNEVGRSLIVDPITKDIFVGANTSFLNEIGNNGNSMMARLDTCGQQVILPKINGEPDPTLTFNVENERLIDVRGITLPIYSGSAFIEVLTVRNSSTDRGVVLNFIDEAGCQVGVIDYTPTNPNIDEVVNYAFLEGQTIYVIGTWPGQDMHAFVMGIDLSQTNPVYYKNYIFANNFPHQTTGESAMIYNGELYLTGAEGNDMYIAKINPIDGELISPTSVNTIDVDGDPTTKEVGKTIKHISGEINVMGDLTSSSFTPPSTDVRPFLVKTNTNIGACNNVVDFAVIYNFAGGDEQVEDMVIRDDKIIFGGRALYEATIVGVPFPNYDTLSQRAYLAELDVNGGISWLKTYEHSYSLSDLDVHGEGYVAVGSTYSPAIPIVGGGDRPDHRDIWTAKTDANGLIVDCDCFDPLESTITVPTFDLDCVTGNVLPDNVQGNLHSFQCEPLDSIQTYCGPPCGFGIGGPPCPSGCCAYISGTKFEDTNCDGVRDPFDPGLCGWQIQLTDGINTWTTTTNAAGFYAFSNLCPGDYVISEVQQTCWNQSFPTGSGTHAVGLNSTTLALGLDFGNCIEIDCGMDLGSQLVSIDPDSCKWNLAYDQFLCPALQVNRIELISNTPGVDLTDLVLKSGLQFDPFHPATPQKVSIYNGQNTPMPGGAGTDLLCFSLDNICDSTQLPQELIVKYFIDLPCSLEREYCTDTLYTNCAISCPTDCTVDSLNISTGYNPMTNALIPTGGGDVLWQMVATPPAAGWTVPRNSFVIPAHPGWDWSNTATNSRWISGQPNSTFATGNQPPCVAQAYEFERCFCLEEADSVRFNFGMMADDYGRILLRDDPQTTVDTLYSHDCSIWPTGSPAQNFGNPDTVNIVRYLPAGKHCVKAQLWNTDGVAMGFNLQGYIYGDHIVADTCCMVKSAIAGTKFLDSNCNGQRDVINGNLEVGMCDWAIVLCDTFDNPLDTILTDNRGVYSFNCIESGCYRVKEIQRKGWTQTLPTTPYYQVCVDTFEVATDLDFGNCNSVCDSLLAYEGTPTPATCCKWVTLENQQIGFDVTRVNFRTMTPGQTFDYSSITTSSSFISAPLGTATFDVVYQPTGPSPIPTGSYPDAVYVCLTQNGTPVPQLVTVDYHVDGAGYCGDKICTDSIWFDCPPLTICDSVSTSYIPTPDSTDNCCFILNLDNQVPDYFTKVQLKPIGNVDFETTGTSILNPVQWSSGPITNTLIELLSNTGNICPGSFDRYIPVGNFAPVSFCLENFQGSPQQVQVDWIACDGTICSDTLSFECARCIEIFNDTLYCDGAKLRYDFDFKNLWDMDISKLEVEYIQPAGATVTPNSLSFSPSVEIDSTSGTHSLCIDNVGNATEFKIAFKALDEDSCCFCISDTLCYQIPICCDTCESIQYVVTDTICGGEECCYTLDIYHCIDSFFTGIEFNMLGSPHFSQQKAPNDWFMQSPTNKQVTWHPKPTPAHSTYIPDGWSYDKITFCIGGVDDASSVPQQVELNWLAGPNNVACTDTLTFECQPPPPDTCALVENYDFVCDSLDPTHYLLDLDVKILAGFTVEQIRVRDLHSIPAGATFNPALPLVNGLWTYGNVVSMPTIDITGVAPGDSICFYLTLFDNLVGDNGSNHCCHTDTLCVVVPPCQDSLPCSNLDWSGFDLVLDTTNCQPGMLPDVDVVPVFGAVVPDWIEYDFACDLSIEQTDFGPSYPSVLWLSGGNPNFLVCATAYKIVGNDTCDIEIVRDLFLEPCPIVSCCQDSTSFFNAVQNGFTYTVVGNDLTIDNPLLDSCDVATIDWGDLAIDMVTGDNLPITHTYIGTPLPSTYSVCIDVVQTDLDGTLCWQDDVCEIIGIGAVTPNCCQDTIGFENAVDNGFVLTRSALSVTLDNSLLDSCDNMTVDWGDGQSDFLLASDLAFTHNYSGDNSYTVCMNVRREFNGVPCFERQHCDSVFVSPSYEVEPLQGVTIYPNPTDRDLIVDFGQMTSYQEIQVYDAVGRMVMTLNGEGPVQRENLRTNDLPAGVYFVKIALDSYSTTKRFIKQ